jgi:hypothetical protein
VVCAEDKRHRVKKKDWWLLLVWHGNEFISGGETVVLQLLDSQRAEILQEDLIAFAAIVELAPRM